MKLNVKWHIQRHTVLKDEKCLFSILYNYIMDCMTHVRVVILDRFPTELINKS